MSALLDSQVIKEQVHRLGFHQVGIADARVPLARTEDLTNWLAQGYQADMAWMEDSRRQDIQRVLPGVQSVIVAALSYYTKDAVPSGTAKISRYAWGRDYHKVLGGKLKALSRWLQEEAPDHQHRWYVDTGPILEKAWAERAGLGWLGKNTLLLSRDFGSYVFLGVVLTTLPLAADTPTTAHCGTCTRCLDICPTHAFPQPGVLDSNHCIAYHTIENRSETLPSDLPLSDWVVGCDLCQSVCPYNQRLSAKEIPADFLPREGVLTSSLEDLATMDDHTFDQWSRGMALRRVKAKGLRRNALHALRSRNR
jgi:epoxyqueuosine reductase